jgi:trans-aconitate methyltransferase
MTDLTEHWQEVYLSKATNEVSWYERDATASLRLIRQFADVDASVLDVGTGASPLLGQLQETGFSDCTGLDISERALSLLRDSLLDGPLPTLIAADVTTWQPERQYQVWHDRAVFHFMAGEARSRYLSTMASGLAVGGHAIIGTFDLDGPTHCSGIAVQRYDAAALSAVVAPWCDVVHTESTMHVTPWGDSQPFTWVVGLRRETSQ